MRLSENTASETMGKISIYYLSYWTGGLKPTRGLSPQAHPYFDGCRRATGS